jgi:hypothetical protein
MAMDPQPLSTLTVGLAATRGALVDWLHAPWKTTRVWLAASALAASVLLLGTLVVAEVVSPDREIYLGLPPVTAAGPRYVLHIIGQNLLVLALHSMACVAGFIAGSSLPHEATRLKGIRRAVHRYGAKFAIGFVVIATTFSMTYQAWLLGTAAASVGYELHVSPALLLLALLPHAIPELMGLFLPLGAWVIASRRGTWDELLAAALLTTVLAIPLLIIAATWETYGAPHLIALAAGR